MQFRQPWIALAAALWLCLLAIPAGAQTSTVEPGAFVQDLAQEAITTVATPKMSSSERIDRFRQLFVSSFDLPGISRFVLARYWQAATPDQRQEFIRLFEELQVMTWAQRFADYNGQKLEVIASTAGPDREYLVDSRLVLGTDRSLPVQWRVAQDDDGKLRVRDIVVEGVSMALTQRSDYNALLQRSGGQLEALLSVLKGKIEQLRAAG